MERQDAKLSLLKYIRPCYAGKSTKQRVEEGLVPFEYKDEKKSKIKNYESSFLVSKCGEQSCELLVILQN